MSVAVSAPPLFRDQRLEPLWDKVQAGERLDRDEGLLLFATEDLHGVGRLADAAKRRRHGDQVFFVMNRYMNPTNLCVLSCSFCDFAKKKGEAGAFEHSIEDVLAMIKPGTREAHIVGGHHPDWPFEYYERLIGAIHAARPETQIKAFTAAEIDYLWRRWKIEPREALTRLKAAGLALDARRRRRDLLQAPAEAPALHRQGRRRPLVRDPRHRALARPQDERDDALRPRRDARGARRPPAPPAAAAGRCRADSSPSSRCRIRSGPPSSCRARRRRRTTCAPSPSRGCSSTTSRTSRPTG